MSGFSAELIDYLEGRITFEEFDKRRDERKAKVKTQLREKLVPGSVNLSRLREQRAELS